MDHKTFKEFAGAMAEYIANYLENIRERRVLPTVEPGYLRPLVPADAPEVPEKWQDIMSDIEKVIMPGVTHWHSPRFHAYFPTANSYPAIVADMLSDAIACIGFSWIASPACTELEVVMLDWLGKLLDLPKEFLACSGGKGGGVIQGTASEATLVALLAAKARALKKAKAEHPTWTDYEIISKFRAYASKGLKFRAVSPAYKTPENSVPLTDNTKVPLREQAHSSVERAGLLGGIQFVLLDTDERHRLRGDTLSAAIKKDLNDGLIPFYVVATLGTTSSCAFDVLDEMGDVCQANNVWLHVDAAYAGSAFICPEFRYLMAGIEKADSFNFNPHKWMLITFDCSAMWFKDTSDVVDAFNVDPLYLKHEQQGAAPDYRHWQIPLGRRFRSLKIWFVLRLYGAENLRAHIRKQVGLAHLFESLVLEDNRFEIFGEVIMGLVCFRLKGSNEQNEQLLKMINANGKIHLVPSKIKETYFLRMAICSRYTEEEDIRGSWAEIQQQASNLLK